MEPSSGVSVKVVAEYKEVVLALRPARTVSRELGVLNSKLVLAQVVLVVSSVVYAVLALSSVSMP